MGREPSRYEGVRVASASTIEIDFYYAGERCKERIKAEPTPANLRKMSQFRSAVLLAIERGDFEYDVTFPNSKKAKKFSKSPNSSGLTVEAYLTSWLADKQKQISAMTYRDYSSFIHKLFIPAFGNLLLRDLKWVDVKKMLSAQTCGNGRLLNIQSCLRSALTTAVQDEILDANILTDKAYTINEPFDPDEGEHVDPFTSAEQAAILEKSPAQFANLIKFAFWSGLRTSELVALNWRDIDFERGEVRVSKALTRAAKAPEDTKTVAGRRLVKLLTPAREALEAQKPYSFLKNQEVFQHPNLCTRWRSDKPIRDDFWVKILPLAGVRYRKPYQTRHTYASMMLSAGEHPMWVAKQMGHANWSMIAQIYGRWMPEASPNAGSKAELMFGKTDQKTDQEVDQTGVLNRIPEDSTEIQ